jgi:hypothetical protein
MVFYLTRKNTVTGKTILILLLLYGLVKIKISILILLLLYGSVKMKFALRIRLDIYLKKFISYN